VEKELSQLGQTKSALESAYSHFDSADFAKVIEYIDKIVLVFSPGCTKVCTFCILLFCFGYLLLSEPIL
jgi:tRNA A37 methylthiotransferase MiaB